MIMPLKSDKNSLLLKFAVIFKNILNGKDKFNKIFEKTSAERLLNHCLKDKKYPKNINEKIMKIFTYACIIYSPLGFNYTHFSVTLQPRFNGIVPPLVELQAAGVGVHLSCDNVYDSWSPFGTGNILEKLNHYCEIFGKKGQRELTDSL